MQHYFGSAAIVQDTNFEHLKDEAPQQAGFVLEEVIMLSHGDGRNLANDYSYLMMKVAAHHIPHFKFLLDFVPEYLRDGYTEQMKQKSVVVPLGAVHKNEQSYGDEDDA